MPGHSNQKTKTSRRNVRHTHLHKIIHIAIPKINRQMSWKPERDFIIFYVSITDLSRAIHCPDIKINKAIRPIGTYDIIPRDIFHYDKLSFIFAFNNWAGCRHKFLFGILLFDSFKLKILAGQFIARSFQSENQNVPSGRMTSSPKIFFIMINYPLSLPSIIGQAAVINSCSGFCYLIHSNQRCQPGNLLPCLLYTSDAADE